MSKSVILVATHDYIVTRKLKNHIGKFTVALVPAVLAWVVLTKCTVKTGVSIHEVFSSFVNVLISAVAILISFSIAIITIMVSADNDNLRLLKNAPSSECKPMTRGGEPIVLFQVLLSNITYNVFIEAIFLLILIGYIFVQMYAAESLIKILMAIGVFFIVHIFHVLLESVGQMYLTFWKKDSE